MSFAAVGVTCIVNDFPEGNLDPASNQRLRIVFIIQGRYA